MRLFEAIIDTNHRVLGGRQEGRFPPAPPNNISGKPAKRQVTGQK